MADQIRHRTVTVPAGTPITSPQQTSMAFPGGEVERVDIYIPPGHAGLTGFQILAAHQPVIPFDVGEFIVAEDDRLIYPLEDYPDSGSWQFSGYNLDVFPHTFYVTFLLKIVRQNIVVVGGPTPYAAPADTGNLGTGVTVVPVSEPPDTGIPEPNPGDDVPPPDDTDTEPPPDDTPEPVDVPDDTEPPPDTTPDDTFIPPPDEPAPPAEEPAPPPPPPPPPPAPIFTYVEYQGWQPDGDVFEYHYRVDGPRAGQLILASKLGNYGRAPTHLSKALQDIGWQDAGPFWDGRNVRFFRLISYRQTPDA